MYPSNKLDPDRYRNCSSCGSHLSGTWFHHAYDSTCFDCYNKRRLALEDVIMKWIVSQTQTKEAGALKELTDALTAMNVFLDHVKKPYPLPFGEK